MTKRSILMRLLIPLAILVGGATTASQLNFLPTSGTDPLSETLAPVTGEGEGGEGGPGNGNNPKLEATDLGTGWSSLTEGNPANTPVLSDALSFSKFCGSDVAPPFEAEAEDIGAFRRKDAKGAEGAAKGQSKLLAQRFMRYANDGEGGTSGADKAQQVLDYFKTLVNTADCTWTTQDPNGVERVWTIVVEPDPELGEAASGKSLHFRVSSTLGAGEGSAPIVNDILIVKRGRTLNFIMETSPGAETPEQAEANKGEAKGHAGKADTKVKDNGNGA